MGKLVLAAMLLTALVGGCGGDSPNKLLETAQFEEKQSNREHARKLYAEIVAKYPNSPEAKQARERLEAMSTK